MTLALTLISTLPENVHASVEPFLFPVATRLEGVGGSLGLAVGARHLIDDDFEILAGAFGGEVNGEGFMLNKVPVGWKRLHLNADFGHLQRANFDTVYARGFNTDEVFRQRVSGDFMAMGFDLDLWPDNVALSVGYAMSRFALDGFSREGRSIELPNRSAYHDIKTTSKILKLSYDPRNPILGHQTTEYVASVGLVTAEGRIGQSDTLTSDWNLAGRWPMSPGWAIAARGQWSDAIITSKKTAYTTTSAVKATLNSRCATLPSTTSINDCQALEDSLASYIAANNQSGTAIPLGGSQGLRSYNELSLRAAHNRLLTIEARRDLSNWLLPNQLIQRQVQLEFVPSLDLGWSSDQGERIFAKTVAAWGSSLRLEANKLNLSLGYAKSPSEQAWYLAMGGRL